MDAALACVAGATKVIIGAARAFEPWTLQRLGVTAVADDLVRENACQGVQSPYIRVDNGSYSCHIMRDSGATVLNL